MGADNGVRSAPGLLAGEESTTAIKTVVRRWVKATGRLTVLDAFLVVVLLVAYPRPAPMVPTTTSGPIEFVETEVSTEVIFGGEVPEGYNSQATMKRRVKRPQPARPSSEDYSALLLDEESDPTEE